MFVLPLLLPMLLPLIGPPDPAPSLIRSKSWTRRHTCTRTDPATLNNARPGVVLDPGPRGDFADRSVLVCSELVMRPGLRHPRDEAVLAELDTLTRPLALAASTAAHEGRTWLVEVNYPHVEVAQKIRFALQNALLDDGVSVSDRVPVLQAGDVEVITRLPPGEAYPAACRRFTDNGSVRTGDALLYAAVLDRQETTLHAGVCADGQWSWLR